MLNIDWPIMFMTYFSIRYLLAHIEDESIEEFVKKTSIGFIVLFMFYTVSRFVS